MALRRRGKDNFYHAYFRRLVMLPDGRLQRQTTTVNLGTADLATARAMEAELMAKAKAARLHQRATAHLQRLEVEAGAASPELLPEKAPQAVRRKRLKLADWAAAVAKYRKIGKDAVQIVDRFVSRARAVYFDEIDDNAAFRYLTEYYGGESAGKSFNNNKSALNSIFRLLRIDAGMKRSPFDDIPNRMHEGEHQRPFSEEEFIRIYRAASEPWRTASLIAWHTGLRKESVFNLRWSALEGDVLTALPGKTARYGRAVRIPLHPQLLEVLRKLPRVDDYLLGCFGVRRGSREYATGFGQLLDSLGIKDDARGSAKFNSFRNSFITRCDEANVPRHATRGIVGQMEDSTTDLYSHDLASARLIQKLPPVNLDKPE